MKVDVSIVLCTYNRSFLLKKCLDALLIQIVDPAIDVFVVDNNSSDDTKKVVEQYCEEYPFVKYVFENKQGLSTARNRGWNESESTWIAYLDDDGIPHDNYIERLLYVINVCNFDCFGGMYYAYYESSKPKWIADNFGTKNLIRNDIGLIDEYLLSGGIFNVKKSVLQNVGGFKENYGMNGKKVAYGEESELQYRIGAAGFKIGFDPELKMDHLVASYKLTLWWQLNREYALFRDSPRLRRHDKTYSKLVKSFFYCTFQRLPKLVGKFIIRKDYFWQNLVIDYLKPMLGIHGTMRNPLNNK